MKKIYALLVIIIFSAGFFNTQAQVGNYLLKKTKQATVRAGQKSDEEATEEMNKEVDKGVEKAFNKFFGEDETESDQVDPSSEEGSDDYSSEEDENARPSKSSSSSSSDARASGLLKAMGVNIAPTNINEVYNYSGNILMDVQSWKKMANLKVK